MVGKKVYDSNDIPEDILNIIGSTRVWESLEDLSKEGHISNLNVRDVQRNGKGVESLTVEGIVSENYYPNFNRFLNGCKGSLPIRYNEGEMSEYEETLLQGRSVDIIVRAYNPHYEPSSQE